MACVQKQNKKQQQKTKQKRKTKTKHTHIHLPLQHDFPAATVMDLFFEQILTPGQNSCMKSGSLAKIGGSACD
jgi:hypothetical protein